MSNIHFNSLFALISSLILIILKGQSLNNKCIHQSNAKEIKNGQSTCPEWYRSDTAVEFGYTRII